MIDSEKVKFVTTLTAVADYYGKELSTGVIDLYWQGLREYDIDLVQKALWTHARNPDTGQFMPKIADVAKVMQGRTGDQAAVAWSKVNQAVRRVGTYQSVVFDDPIIHRVLSDMGGWTLLGTKTEDEWPFIARDFENRYRGYRMRDETPEYTPVLLGIAEVHNSSEGFKSQKPTLIGDKEKAEQVRIGGSNAPLLNFTTAGDATVSAVKQIGKAA